FGDILAGSPERSIAHAMFPIHWAPRAAANGCFTAAKRQTLTGANRGCVNEDGGAPFGGPAVERRRRHFLTLAMSLRPVAGPTPLAIGTTARFAWPNRAI